MTRFLLLYYNSKYHIYYASECIGIAQISQIAQYYRFLTWVHEIMLQALYTIFEFMPVKSVCFLWGDLSKVYICRHGTEGDKKTQKCAYVYFGWPLSSTGSEFTFNNLWIVYLSPVAVSFVVHYISKGPFERLRFLIFGVSSVLFQWT